MPGLNFNEQDGGVAAMQKTHETQRDARAGFILFYYLNLFPQSSRYFYSQCKGKKKKKGRS